MNNPADDDINLDISDTGLSNQEMKRQLIAQKLVDAQTPGFQAEFYPDEAELLGAFKEDALNENDALDSNIDQPDSVDGGQ